MQVIAMDTIITGEPMETEMVPQKSFQERKLDPDKETQEKTVFVKNLSYDVEEAKLKEIFSKVRINQTYDISPTSPVIHPSASPPILSANGRQD